MLPDFLLPDWVPNLHPLIVHFPIALLVVAIAVDVFALALRRWVLRWVPPIRVVAALLYLATGVSAVVTYYSGLWGLEAVRVPPGAGETLNEHMTYAWYTMVYTGVYGAVRLGASLVKDVRRSLLAHVVLLGVGVGGMLPLWKAGENGGKMVYRHGVGVEDARPAPASGNAEPAAKDTTREGDR